jgi:catechol-2,3-dioxygenase
MLQILAIDHIVLRTTKLTEMLEFYINVLNCTIERETPKETGLTQLRAGNALIDLVNVKSRLGAAGGGAPSQNGRNVDHFCLQIKSMSEQDIIDFLKKKEVQMGDFEDRYGAQGDGRSIYIKDPEGNGVELRCAI